MKQNQGQNKNKIKQNKSKLTHTASTYSHKNKPKIDLGIKYTINTNHLNTFELKRGTSHSLN